MYQDWFVHESFMCDSFVELETTEDAVSQARSNPGLIRRRKPLSPEPLPSGQSSPSPFPASTVNLRDAASFFASS